MIEGVGFEDAWISIICVAEDGEQVYEEKEEVRHAFKVAIIHCNANAIQSQGSEEFCICLGEEVLKVLFSQLILRLSLVHSPCVPCRRRTQPSNPRVPQLGSHGSDTRTPDILVH